MSTVSETTLVSGEEGRVTRRIVVEGRVQGVGYRYFVASEAAALAVAGWVRNRFDGSVEAVLQGVPASVDAVVAWARRGPPAARVAQLDVSSATGELDRSYAGFERLPSA
jgi:acylphosphatase